jgi:DNA-binding CsgD family transcriptional regulator/catechol 2,3-dioxygenase-like lactoylglutathione lyase family enzyme
MARRGRGRPPHPDILTPAEWSILDAWRHGMTRALIAERRGVSVHAVRYHLRNIAGKLGVERSSELRQWPGFPVTSGRRTERNTHMNDTNVASGAGATTAASAKIPSNATGGASGASATTAAGDASPKDAVSATRGAGDALELGPLGQVSMYARSAPATEAWYRDVLQLPHIFTFGDLVFFDCGGIRLYLHAVGEEKWRPSSVLYFLVPDIAQAHRELTERGVKFQGAPHMIYKDDTTGVEDWMAFFDDPDGNMLAIMAHVAPEAAAAAAS